METFAIVLGVLLLIWGLLQIILFFKIWIMADNVDELHELVIGKTKVDFKQGSDQILEDCDKMIKEVRRMVFIGEKDRARKLLMGVLFDCDIELKEYPKTREDVSNKINAAIDEIGLR